MREPYQLPATGFVRLRNLIAPSGPIPASRSTVNAWTKAGLFPAPVPIGMGKIKGYRVEEVRAFLANPTTFQTAQPLTEDGPRDSHCTSR